MSTKQNEKLLDPIGISRVTLFGNLLLALGKLAAGVLGRSSAMVADAIHSASDVGSTVMVLFALRIAGKAPDAKHEYGHERFESLAALLLSLALGATGVGIGWSALTGILSGAYLSAPLPTVLPLAAACVSIAVKEAMYHLTMRAARLHASDALRADAWHHRSDALSSVGSLLGIAGARMGCPILDPAAGLIICVLILKSAWDILSPAVDKLTDASCDAQTEAAIREAVRSVQGVQRINKLQTRRFGPRVYVDIEIAADGQLRLIESHAIAERVHLLVEERFPAVKHCMVHVDPVMP